MNSIDNEKIVVFDMDETIGHFSQLYVIWDLLIKLSNTQLSSVDFYNIADIFDSYFHPEIINIIVYLRNNNIRTVIYTNNQGPWWWPRLIARYLDYKSSHLTHKYGLFIKEVIGAYKIHDKMNDRRRTSHGKSYEDLSKILDLFLFNKVIFFDDQEHKQMRNKNVTYVKVPKYITILPPNIIASLFLQSTYGKGFLVKNSISPQDFIESIFKLMHRYNYSLKNPTRCYSFINLTQKIKNFIEN